ncbi:hypothetical protein M5689_023318 [Euphorbia peplus]|nr:hypothetical protein M5689_023318 [Euphorbia peplus]
MPNDLPIDDLFRNMPNGLPIDEITDWKDLSPGASRNVLHLTKMDGRELVRIGIEFLSEIKGKLSQRTIGKMFILAYNLTDSRNQAVFDDIHVDLSSPEYRIALEELSDDFSVTITGEPQVKIVLPQQLTTDQRIVQVKNALCYLAASYLRLYTKSAENYSRVSVQLKENYIDYFKTPLPLENFHPSLQAINGIKRIFELSKNLRDTFYNLVYAGEQIDVGNSLKNYLYRTHISFTGLHPLVLFIRCRDVLKVDNVCLLNALALPVFKTERASLARVFETFYTDDAMRSKKMWKYARIFNHKFLMSLQTKNCQLFTAVLANMVLLSEAQGASSNQNVLNIVQIQNLSEMMKQHAKDLARRAVQQIVESRGSGLSLP